MAGHTRPIQFRDLLPEVFRTDEVGGVSTLSRFLTQFETLFEELQNAVEGTPGAGIELTVEAVAGATITVGGFGTGPVGFPSGTVVTAPGRSLRTTLAQPIPPQRSGVRQIEVAEGAFAGALQAGDIVQVHAGGIPDLFNPDTTPPPQFAHRPQPGDDFPYLAYLASWIALPLRADKPAAERMAFNRDLVRAIFAATPPLVEQRGTLPGLEALLRLWLQGDLRETAPPLPILTDLSRASNDVDAVFQLGETATLGFNTVLGEGPPFFFIVDLLTDPTVRALRHPAGIDVLQRAAQALLDGEKPAHTYYQLRLQAHTMQLAPAGPAPAGGFPFPYAQIGETTLLWGPPTVYESDC